MDAEALAAAIEAQNWYAVAAIVIGGLIFAWKRFAPVLWEKIPGHWRFLVPLAMAAATGFVAAFYEGKELPVALLKSVVAAFYAGLPAAGGHHALKDMPIPYGKGRHPKPADRDG